jgi:heme exporter protein B
VTRVIQDTLLIALKDLRIESRSRQTLSLVVVLGILIVTVLGLGLGSTLGKEGSPSAVAVLWIAYLFSGVLCFEKTMDVERRDGALAGLMLAPLDRGIIYAAKLLSNLTLMVTVAAVITPVGVLFFGFDLSPAPFRFLTIIFLSMLGFAAVGTLFSALASSSRLQGGFLAMLVFPVTLPLVIASTQISNRLYDPNQTLTGSSFAILIAFDAIFLTVSWLAFEWVLEP